ncbi:CBO0543 family protein [Neobacillus vireti]|uniref:CBO0543 family protein n=1 Tax=Neobacillus vireti TaxID=220686 RepID=UPI003000C310
MVNKFEIRILRILFIFGIGALLNLIRKPPMKDWIIIFLLKSYIASILDNLLVKKGYFKYPVNLFKTFDISVLFSYLIFPISCIYFNQVTKNSTNKGILLKCLLFSLPSAVAEHWLEKNTKLIKYKKSWTSVHSFFSIASTFLLSRFLIALIRKATQKQ